MRQELELAKVEIKAEAKKAGQGAGMFGPPVSPATWC